MYIIILTIIELAVINVVGALPGISSAFTRKYVYGSGGSKATGFEDKTDFSRLQEKRAGGGEPPIELFPRSSERHIVGTSYTDGSSSKAHSTDDIIHRGA